MRLERFYTAKKSEVEVLRQAAEQGALPEIPDMLRPDFAAALQTPSAKAPVAVIAEYKRASPSLGVICESLEVEEASRQYAVAGARALSILTEEQYFHGNLSFLERAAAPDVYPSSPLPLLRKDFIFDPLQVLATAATRASALLLIVRLTPNAAQLRQLRELAEKSGIQAVVEVFDAQDLHTARESGARIIQVNARDLDNLVVDRMACCKLAMRYPPEKRELWVAASGISRHEHLVQAADAGYQAVLAGSSLMKNGRPGANLTTLLNDQNQDSSHAN
jgi:indole-3-glycerol phosphate synthase